MSRLGAIRLCRINDCGAIMRPPVMASADPSIDQIKKIWFDRII